MVSGGSEVPSWGDCAPSGHLSTAGDVSVWRFGWVVGVLRASGGRSLGLLLTSPEHRWPLSAQDARPAVRSAQGTDAGGRGSETAPSRAPAPFLTRSSLTWRLQPTGAVPSPPSTHTAAGSALVCVPRAVSP